MIKSLFLILAITFVICDLSKVFVLPLSKKALIASNLIFLLEEKTLTK